MPTAERRVERFYQLFSGRNFAGLTSYLSSDVQYMQLNSMSIRTMPQGPRAVTAALANWGDWFPEYDILGPVIAEMAQIETRKVGGAVTSFEAQYSLAGTYAKAIPNLRDRPLTVGEHQSVYITDKLWLNGGGQITRITSSFIIF